MTSGLNHIINTITASTILRVTPVFISLIRLKVDDYIQSEAHRKLSLDAAMATVVLMKNNLTMGKTLPITSPVNTACVSHVIVM